MSQSLNHREPEQHAIPENISHSYADHNANNPAKEYPASQCSCSFNGQVGSGKTHLSMAIANSLMEKGVGVLYMPYRDNIISLKQNMMDEEYYRKVMNKFKRAKVLLIDDLFKGSISGSDVNIMFEIINYRYLNGLPVIVSCEKSIDEIMNIDEAIGSRLYEMSCGYVASFSGRRLNYRMYRKS